MIQPNEYGLFELFERVKDLEAKVYRTKRTVTTRAQQMLLLKHLGLLDKINDLDIKKEAKAKLLSILLNNDAVNIENDLSTINANNSPLVTKSNFEFLTNTFKNTGLKSQAEKVQKILDQLPKK